MAILTILINFYLVPITLKLLLPCTIVSIKKIWGLIYVNILTVPKSKNIFNTISSEWFLHFFVCPYFLVFKATVNLFSYGKKRSYLKRSYENNHYITPYKNNFFLLNMYFSFYHIISVFISLWSQPSSSF